MSTHEIEKSRSTDRETDRRGFLRHVASTSGAMALGLAWPSATARAEEVSHEDPPGDSQRSRLAEKIRTDAARLARKRPQPDHPNNGEEKLYPNRIASYSKGLPHNRLGEVDSNAYRALLEALESGENADFERIPLGLGRRQTNPQAAFAFDLEGADSHHMAIAPAPTIAGGQAAGELVELYWMALARDVGFSDYDTDPTVAAGARELSRLSDFRGPRAGAAVTAATLFRGNTPGDLAGPYLSQFLWMDIPMGAVLIPQRMRTPVAGDDYLTSYEDWLSVQNGASS